MKTRSQNMYRLFDKTMVTANAKWFHQITTYITTLSDFVISNNHLQAFGYLM